MALVEIMMYIDHVQVQVSGVVENDGTSRIDAITYAKTNLSRPFPWSKVSRCRASRIKSQAMQWTATRRGCPYHRTLTTAQVNLTEEALFVEAHIVLPFAREHEDE